MSPGIGKQQFAILISGFWISSIRKIFFSPPNNFSHNSWLIIPFKRPLCLKSSSLCLRRNFCRGLFCKPISCRNLFADNFSSFNAFFTGLVLSHFSKPCFSPFSRNFFSSRSLPEFLALATFCCSKARLI